MLGPEAPLIALGSVVGIAVDQDGRAPTARDQVLSTAGSFSAISALFGGPLVAGMLMLEAGAGLGATLIPVLLPGLVAAALGYLVFVGIGDWGGVESRPRRPRPSPLRGTHVRDLLLAIVVGVVAALS